jgi:hypothetical protein
VNTVAPYTIVRGEADIGVQQPAELLPVPGIELIGPLPPELRQLLVLGWNPHERERPQQIAPPAAERPPSAVR